ncbi:MAG: hypothetical protein P9L94_16250 [Candidatus Hinthialibacter antarcticus]|nr:hypothetical protein [Candidatus Hinthialibacter antarcticus]
MSKDFFSTENFIVWGFLIPLVFLLIEVRKRRLDSEYKINIFIPIWSPVGFFLLYSFVLLRDFLYSTLAFANHILLSFTISIVLFVLCYWFGLKRLNAIKNHNRENAPSLEQQRLGVFFTSLIMGLMTFHTATFQNQYAPIAIIFVGVFPLWFYLDRKVE